MLRFAVAISIALLANSANAQTTFYGADGRYQGQAVGPAFPGGSTQFYGADGRYQGQSVPPAFSGGSTQFYGADGRYQGQATPAPFGTFGPSQRRY